MSGLFEKPEYSHDDAHISSKLGLSACEKCSAMSIDNSQFHIETSIDRKHIKTDIRPCVQLSTDLNKIGFYVGYSYGLRNYQVRLIGGLTEAFSRMWRLGFLVAFFVLSLFLLPFSVFNDKL